MNSKYLMNDRCRLIVLPKHACFLKYLFVARLSVSSCFSLRTSDSPSRLVFYSHRKWRQENPVSHPHTGISWPDIVWLVAYPRETIIVGSVAEEEESFRGGVLHKPLVIVLCLLHWRRSTRQLQVLNLNSSTPEESESCCQNDPSKDWLGFANFPWPEEVMLIKFHRWVVSVKGFYSIKITSNPSKCSPPTRIRE